MFDDLCLNPNLSLVSTPILVFYPYLCGARLPFRSAELLCQGSPTTVASLPAPDSRIPWAAWQGNVDFPTMKIHPTMATESRKREDLPLKKPFMAEKPDW